MGVRRDLERYRTVGEERREDLADFIRYGDLGRSREDRVSIPIKIVDLPAFVYDRRDKGGVGQAGEGREAEVGDPVEIPGVDGESGEPGEGEGDHGYYEMDPEEFAEALEEEFELELEPKGKVVVEETEGDLTDEVRSGPNSTLNVKRMFKRGLKRRLARDFDPEYYREALRVRGLGPAAVHRWAREEKRAPVGLDWLETAYDEIPDAERDRWASLEEMERAVDERPVSARRRDINRIRFRREDERYRYPEVVEDRESKVVVVNIRDVSGSMGREKRELVERVFTPLDWYLQGKYEQAEFVYVAHDVEAWRVDREEFFGIQSGGGTRVSSAYELARDVLDAAYPWSEWNRYVFAAGDGENSSNDTTESVIPLMEAMDVNTHAYVETQPGGGSVNATHSQELEEHFGDGADVCVTRVTDRDDVMEAIRAVLATASGAERAAEEVRA